MVLCFQGGLLDALATRRDEAVPSGVELRDQVIDLRGKLATMTAQRDAAVHDAERETAYGHQRVDDLRTRHEEKPPTAGGARRVAR